MRKRQCSGLFVGVLLMVLTTGPAAGAEASDNPSSHEAGFFNELLAGRVYIQRQVWRNQKWEWANVVRAYYRDTEGNMIGCNPYGQFVGRWVVWADERRRTKAFSWKPDKDRPADYKPTKGNVLFYEPESGELRLEGWKKISKKPYVGTQGWVQESWPRAAVAWCPDLELPAELPINERQTAKYLDDMRKQDPDAPIRHFMGVPGTSLGEGWMARIAEAPEAESGPRED